MHECPECGAALPEGAPEGLCPRCLLKQALKTQISTSAEGSHGSSKTTQYVANLPVPGTRIRYFGDYEILEEIARGGMGIVYKARQLKLNRVVAVKMILAGNLASETEVKRFLSEAQAAANLQHPNIVAIHEVGEFSGQHYFSMDYVDGKNLADVCKEEPLPVAKAAQYLKTIAEAVHFAHQRGTLHRDLKPQNVLIDPTDQPRITDFGLAKQLSQESSLTLSSMVMGSPSYMPPEQAAGQNDQVGPPSDVYSLGAILYQLLTGRAPFVGDNAIEVMRQVREDEPVAPSKLNRKIPADLETICLRCLEKQPERRYASARAMAEDLERFQNHEPIEARRPGVTRRAWSWTVRHPWALTGSASVVLLLFVGLLFGIWEENKLLRWQMDHPGRQPNFQPEDFFPTVNRAFLFIEFFVLQILPLVFFIRARIREQLTRSKLLKYAALGIGQTGFGLFLILKLNAVLVWTTPSPWFSAAIAFMALTNIWFGFRLLWHTGHEYKTQQSGVGATGQPLALIGPVKYYPLLMLLIVEAIGCGIYVREWSRFFSCIGVVFGINLLALLARMLWLARGEERIIYLPPLLMSAVLLVLGLKGVDYTTRQFPLLAAIGIAGSVLIFLLVRLERTLAQPVSRQTKFRRILGHCWRAGSYVLRALAVLLVIFYLVENWRGNRAWKKTKAELLAKGAHLDIEFVKPKPIPDDQNIMQVPIMATWFIKDSPLKTTPIAKRYKQLGEAMNKTPSHEVPPVELVMVAPDSKTEVPANAVVFDLADLQTSRQRFAQLYAHLPAGRYLVTANNTLVIEHGTAPGQQVPPIYLRSATSQSLDQLKNLFKQYGLLEPFISSSKTPDANVFQIRLTSRAKTAADIIQFTEPFQPEFDEIRAALRRPGCYLQPTSEVVWEAPTMNFVASRIFAQLADARARSFLLLNRPVEAWQELALVNEFRRCLESNSWNLVTAMIDVAIAGLLVSSVEQGYSLHGWTVDQYADIQKELERINLMPAYRNSVEGERAATLQLLDMPRNVMARVFGGSVNPGTVMLYLVPQGWISQNKVFLAQQHQRVFEAMDDHDGATPRYLTDNTPWLPYTVLANQCLPNYVKARATLAKNQNRANLAACAFALERYRVKYGQYPEKLDALIPEFKAKLPLDIANGEPLKYRREAPDRFVLHSIGWGGKGPDADWVWTSCR